ncbi:hypothetical protein ANN_13306 [Periplaneta americana]|uniref:Uncharacterized protein n=1 Tax=Periplaneta americana TaxID=6978 RepID=A0ABQ8TJJ5_PERAM|nr:hypothetical protein ANN_13306 [Periplaneta americana]
MNDQRIPKKILNTKPEGRRNIGRQKLRWLDGVEEDLRTLGARRWRQKALVGQEWTKILREAKARLQGPRWTEVELDEEEEETEEGKESNAGSSESLPPFRGRASTDGHLLSRPRRWRYPPPAPSSQQQYQHGGSSRADRRMIIVLNNAPYHCLQIDKPPSAYAVKTDMISWLRKKEVNCDERLVSHSSSFKKPCNVCIYLQPSYFMVTARRRERGEGSTARGRPTRDGANGGREIQSY